MTADIFYYLTLTKTFSKGFSLISVAGSDNGSSNMLTNVTVIGLPLSSLNFRVEALPSVSRTFTSTAFGSLTEGVTDVTSMLLSSTFNHDFSLGASFAVLEAGITLA